jgi:Pyruvate/2-oxoacid:ferredoxin oxidoreductase delta subunit
LCNYCVKHGGGTRWYLNPENYSVDLLADKRARKVLAQIIGWSMDYYIDWTTRMASLTQKPFVGNFIRWLANKQAPNMHAGQIIPLEDALKIVDLAENLVVISCMCRRLISAENKLCCLNFGPVRELWKKAKPTEKIEPITRDEAKYRLRNWAKEGLIHTLFCASIPYPITICNCEIAYCAAMKMRLAFGIRNACLKSHYVATLDIKKCDGCRGNPHCVQYCQFKAIIWIREKNKVAIDLTKCFGCGTCRMACPKRAIRLVDRSEMPIVRNSW